MPVDHPQGIITVYAPKLAQLILPAQLIHGQRLLYPSDPSEPSKLRYNSATRTRRAIPITSVLRIPTAACETVPKKLKCFRKRFCVKGDRSPGCIRSSAHPRLPRGEQGIRGNLLSLRALGLPGSDSSRHARNLFQEHFCQSSPGGLIDAATFHPFFVQDGGYN